MGCYINMVDGSILSIEVPTNTDTHKPEQIKAARMYAASINRDIAAHVFDPDFGFASHVTKEEKQRYYENQLQKAEDIEEGRMDTNFTVWQRMNYYLTGECVPFLP